MTEEGSHIHEGKQGDRLVGGQGCSWEWVVEHIAARLSPVMPSRSCMAKGHLMASVSCVWGSLGSPRSDMATGGLLDPAGRRTLKSNCLSNPGLEASCWEVYNVSLWDVHRVGAELQGKNHPTYCFPQPGEGGSSVLGHGLLTCSVSGDGTLCGPPVGGRWNG